MMAKAGFNYEACLREIQALPPATPAAFLIKASAMSDEAKALLIERLMGRA